MNFDSLKRGDRARISSFDGLADAYRNRLLSLGLTPGTEIVIEHIAPLGDPVEIVVRGFRLSLRREEAAGVVVEKL
ncbi:MAG: FeoA family protein [Pseudomonadales bacterium]